LQKKRRNHKRKNRTTKPRNPGKVNAASWKMVGLNRQTRGKLRKNTSRWGAEKKNATRGPNPRVSPQKKAKCVKP